MFFSLLIHRSDLARQSAGNKARYAFEMIKNQQNRLGNVLRYVTQYFWDSIFATICFESLAIILSCLSEYLVGNRALHFFFGPQLHRSQIYMKRQDSIGRIALPQF